MRGWPCLHRTRCLLPPPLRMTEPQPIPCPSRDASSAPARQRASLLDWRTTLRWRCGHASRAMVASRERSLRRSARSMQLRSIDRARSGPPAAINRLLACPRSCVSEPAGGSRWSDRSWIAALSSNGCVNIGFTVGRPRAMSRAQLGPPDVPSSALLLSHPADRARSRQSSSLHAGHSSCSNGHASCTLRSVHAARVTPTHQPTTTGGCN